MGLAADLLGVQSVFLRSLDAVPSRGSRFHTGLAASGVLPTSLISVTTSIGRAPRWQALSIRFCPAGGPVNSKREPGNGQQAHRDFHRLAEKSISRRADRLVSHLPLKSLIYASVGRCPPSPLPSPRTSPHPVSVTSVKTAHSWTCDARRVRSGRPRGYSEKQKLVCCIRSGVRRVLMLVEWTRRFPRRLASAHSLYTQFRTHPQPVHTTVVLPP